MVSATEILASGVFWPRKNTEDHGIIEITNISVHFRVLPWQIAELGQSHSGRRRDQRLDSPCFPIKLLRQRRAFLPDLEGIEASEETLDSFDVERIDPVSLLFQAG
jgi:hypothetical protein